MIERHFPKTLCRLFAQVFPFRVAPSTCGNKKGGREKETEEEQEEEEKEEIEEQQNEWKTRPLTAVILEKLALHLSAVRVSPMLRSWLSQPNCLSSSFSLPLPLLPSSLPMPGQKTTSKEKGERKQRKVSASLGLRLLKRNSHLCFFPSLTRFCGLEGGQSQTQNSQGK